MIKPSSHTCLETEFGLICVTSAVMLVQGLITGALSWQCARSWVVNLRNSEGAHLCTSVLYMHIVTCGRTMLWGCIFKPTIF